MFTKLQKWGNSQGLRFPRELLKDAHITVGDTVDISVRGGEIIVKQVREIRGKYSLEDLLKKMPKRYKASEEQWGPSVGNEQW